MPLTPPPASTGVSATAVLLGVLGLVVVVALAIVITVVVNDHNNTQAASPITPATYPTAAYPSVSSAAPTPTPVVDPETASLQQLQQLADGDRAFVSAQLADRWVPQLSSKHSKEPWTYDREDGVVYDSTSTLQEHQRLRQQYGAKLLWSGDWTTFDYQDYWVTVVPTTFNDPDSVLRWCTSNGLDSDHCSAQIVSTTLGRNGTHAHN